jgi:hypothetical protein
MMWERCRQLPFVWMEVPMRAHELWLYQDPEALKTVLKGLEDSREGRLVDLGSFEQYLEDDTD